MQHRKKNARVLFLSLLLTAILLSGCASSEPADTTGFAMNAVVNIRLYGGDGETGGQILRELSVAEQRISWRDEGSDIARLNRTAGAGEPVSLSDETIVDLQELTALSEASGGAFSVLVGPLTQLWDIGGDSQRVPAQQEIDEVLSLTGQSSLSLTDHGVTLSPKGASIDLGAAGKGIGCDTARKVCEQHPEISGAMVSVGGSVLLYGAKPDGSEWKVGVRDPDGGQNDLIGTLSLPGGCVSTSGDYERFFEEDGVLYHHILNPTDGYPAQSGLRSVTVWHENGSVSDALSTACFVLGKENSLSLLRQYGAEALFLDQDGEITMTEGLKGRFTLSGESGKYTVAGGPQP
ncbi:MAG: FAD:protein FMN transferase [Clostridiales bacterium]|nr:FAD:protein FMN transferase [Clostridiales bacterium]